MYIYVWYIQKLNYYSLTKKIIYTLITTANKHFELYPMDISVNMKQFK